MTTNKAEKTQVEKKIEKKGSIKKQESKKLKTQKLGSKKMKGKKTKKQIKKKKLKKMDLSEMKKKRALRSAKGIKYVLDCTKPVEDTIIEMEGLEKFFQDKIKVDNKTNNLKDRIIVSSDDKKLYITVHIPFSKRYIKYLAKKYIKLHQLRDFLRVVAKGKLVYQGKNSGSNDSGNDGTNTTMLGSAATMVGGVRTSTRRRQPGSATQSSGRQRRSAGGNTNSILKIYGDDSPGLKLLEKITPQAVLFATLMFMATVVILHIVNRI